MQKQDFLRAIDDVFNLEPGTVSADALLQQIDGWDSLTFMSLLMMIDRKCKASLSPADVLKCTTVADLIVLLGDRIAPTSKAA